MLQSTVQEMCEWVQSIRWVYLQLARRWLATITFPSPTLFKIQKLSSKNVIFILISSPLKAPVHLLPPINFLTEEGPCAPPHMATTDSETSAEAQIRSQYAWKPVEVIALLAAVQEYCKGLPKPIKPGQFNSRQMCHIMPSIKWPYGPRTFEDCKRKFCGVRIVYVRLFLSPLHRSLYNFDY